MESMNNIEKDRLILLFELIKDNLINNDFKTQSGICAEITKLFVIDKITIKEKDFLMDYLYLNKPKRGKQYEKFTYGLYWTNGDFWWYPIDEMPRTKRIRINYLIKLIENIK